MKSIKPGRGPSMMGGISSILVGIFGVVWTIGAVSMGAGGLFGIFGLIFIAMAVVSAVYNFKNATSKNRYSTFDITDEHEEPDPWNERFSGKKDQMQFPFNSTDSKFCPYCGTRVEGDFVYCNKCGKKLP